MPKNFFTMAENANKYHLNQSRHSWPSSQNLVSLLFVPRRASAYGQDEQNGYYQARSTRLPNKIKRQYLKYIPSFFLLLKPVGTIPTG
jgi:hypothetical protein